MEKSHDEKFVEGISSLLEECKKEYGVEETLRKITDPFAKDVAIAYFNN